MELITLAERESLHENRRRHIDLHIDRLELVPVVHLVTPDGKSSWMLIELATKEDEFVAIYARAGLGADIVTCTSQEIMKVKDRFGSSPIKNEKFKAVFSTRVYLHMQHIEFGIEE